MIRLILWFALVLVIAATTAFIADFPGSVVMDFPTRRIETSFAALVLFAGFLVLLVGFLVWFIGWLRREMPVVGSNRVLHRQKRGFKLLNQSLVALSAGDHRVAKRLVEQAEVLLPPQPMVHLIAAEASHRAGEHEAAAKRYKALEQSEDGRLIGLRGLLSEARRTGKENEALVLARRAFDENRKSPWVLKTLFALEVSSGNWVEAEAALAKVLKEGLFDKQTADHHRGALAYAEGTEAQLRGDRDAARKHFKRALTVRTGFVPAIAGLVRLELSSGNKKQASKLIHDAWKTAPHPVLAKLFKEIDASESTADWLKRVRGLAAVRPDHPVSLLLLVDALMDARDYSAAKPVLERLLKDAPSRAAWQFRLALAHALEEDPDPVEAALEYAPEGASWYCDDCGTKAASWSPLCPSCDMFDTLEWRQGADIKAPKKTFNPASTITLLSVDS
ncbi:heme biosynthesis protein HemY [Kordiimonas pumila]|uniref:Heme biosynthesis protein HemY n=1 Tax=Kordiimonas pumila TaxID=2161677 RepID=A0ABV7D5I2_9PROT|nr:heme biosynthesis HemY N-terminal domain-containing protein [Kordiimonas pumila]